VPDATGFANVAKIQTTTTQTPAIAVIRLIFGTKRLFWSTLSFYTKVWTK
jgi:hypothetical protein